MGTSARVAILGVGVVGGRMAREIVSPDPAMSVELHSNDPDRRKELRKVFGDRATVGESAGDVGPAVEVVVLAGHQEGQPAAARQHVEAGRHVIAVADRPDTVEALLGLDEVARDRARSLVVGAAFSPGLSCLLARFAAAGLDTVDEVHFARHGAAGPLCAADRLAALRRPVREWRDGTWTVHRAGSGRELCWFPDPVGGADAYRAATAEPLLAVESFVDITRSSARVVLSRWDRMTQYLPVLLPAPPEGGMGAIRVEVRGSEGGSRASRVLGVLDRPGVAAAALGAEVVKDLLAGLAPVGAHGLSSWPDVAGMLARLRVRGVRVAVLQGSEGGSWVGTAGS